MPTDFPSDFVFTDPVENTESGVRIIARSTFIPDMSNSEQDEFAYAYIINISNAGEHPVKLLSRYWIIANAEGDESEVTGEGVVGKQPLIQPDESFQYDSWARISTPLGSMRGHYLFQKYPDKEQMRVAIPQFELRSPQFLN